MADQPSTPQANRHWRPAPIPAIASSSVSSPSAHDADCAEVDELLEGIDRVRIDDLWTTPRSAQPSPGAAPFRDGLFAPPKGSGIAAIATAKPNHTAAALRSKPLRDILDDAAVAPGSAPTPHPTYSRTLSAPAVRNVQSTQHHSKRAPPIARTHSALPAPRPALAPRHPSTLADPASDFPTLFKVYPCPTAADCYARGDHAECFYYHAVESDRRRANVSMYRPHMCRFVEEAGGCRKGDRCPFSHNDFERRYHPDRFGKETCRDFLRGDCPRRYCTFRHEVSSKVEISIAQIDAMTDKEVLQLVLKISDAKGRCLSEKLVRRFGHGKKHSGWRLDGFNPRGREDQKVKYVSARVDAVKRTLRNSGERKWAASLKTSSLRDMMSGVRKVAEEIRERYYKSDHSKADPGPDMQRLIRAVFSNTNWSCHSQEGDNPFIVTPDNQNDALTALERLVDQVVARQQNVVQQQQMGRAGNSRASSHNVQQMAAAPRLRHDMYDATAHAAGGGSLWR